MQTARHLVLPLLFLVALGAISIAQVTQQVDSLEGVGVDEQLGTELPLNLTFRDSKGRSLTLGDIFQGDRPVVLSLNYSDCPMLCQLQLNGLVDGLRELSWNPGQEFDVVSVSIDPLETTTRARQTKQRYVKAFGRPSTAGGWCC